MRQRILTATLVVLFAAACGEEPPPAEEAPPPEAGEEQVLEEAPLPFALTEEQMRGKAVFETVCWSCHGSAGRGDGPAVVAGSVPPPPDFQSPAYARATARQLKRTFETRMETLAEGHPHMKNVLSFLDPQAFEDALSYIPALVYPPELPGSALAGREKFVLRCQGCHGPGGRGDGTAAEALEVKPADFTQDTLLAAKNFDAAFQKVRRGGGGVHGSSMPAWGIMLSDGDVWDLVAYIATFQPGILSDPPDSKR